MDSIAVNCLVQVNETTRQDFVEWLDYHIALGFDHVVVYDAAQNDWLEPLVAKYTKATYVGSSAEWSRKSAIVRSYVSGVKRVEWMVCLDSTEFVWVDPSRFEGIHGFVDAFSTSAITLYTKYMSSARGMKYRVGTQIDCFTHTRPNPEGNNPQNKFTPPAAVTFVKLTNNRMPYRGNNIPVATDWCDAQGHYVDDSTLAKVLGSRLYDPMRFLARCYKFALRSGNEMGFAPGTNPTGFYTVSDPSMQQARERLNRVPVNLETERLFAKSEEPVAVTSTSEKAPAPEPTIPAELQARLAVTEADIECRILEGLYFDDILAYSRKKNINTDPAALEEAFDLVRLKIDRESPVYRRMQELLDMGTEFAQIADRLKLTKSASERMVKVLSVLDIHTGKTRSVVMEGTDSDDIVGISGVGIETDAVTPAEPDKTEEVPVVVPDIVEPVQATVDAIVGDPGTLFDDVFTPAPVKKPKSRKRASKAKKSAPAVAGTFTALPDSEQAE